MPSGIYKRKWKLNRTDGCNRKCLAWNGCKRKYFCKGNCKTCNVEEGGFKDLDRIRRQLFYQLNKDREKSNAHNRRILLSDLTPETIRKVYNTNRKKYSVLTCCLCFKPIVFGDERLKDSLEHLTPVSRGGNSNYNNLDISHLKCNLRKGTMTLNEWFEKHTFDTH